VCVAPTFKIIASQDKDLSTPQTHKLGKGVSKMVLKFLPEIIFRTRNYGTLLLAFIFFVMVIWESLSTWPHAANLDDLVASIPFLLSQVEAVKVEIFSSNQGSRKVNVEKSSIAFMS
jgi:hypothetical protein